MRTEPPFVDGRAVAQLLDDEAVVQGYLRISPLARRLRRRRWFIEWALMDGDGYRVDAQEERLDSLLTELATGQLQLRGKTYTARWLGAQDAEAAEGVFGPDR